MRGELKYAMCATWTMLRLHLLYYCYSFEWDYNLKLIRSTDNKAGESPNFGIVSSIFIPNVKEIFTDSIFVTNPSFKTSEHTYYYYYYKCININIYTY